MEIIILFLSKVTYSKEYWHELHSKNEQICNSDKLLEKTIQSNLGKTKEEKFQKLVSLQETVRELNMLDWDQKRCMVNCIIVEQNKKTISIRFLSKNLVRLRQWCGKIEFKYLMMN